VRGYANGFATNPRMNTVYVAKTNGTVSVISGRTNTVIATVRVSNYTSGIAIPRPSSAYVANESADTVSVLVPCRPGKRALFMRH